MIIKTNRRVGPLVSIQQKYFRRPGIVAQRRHNPQLAKVFCFFFKKEALASTF
jgi:hypothetical protein